WPNDADAVIERALETDNEGLAALLTSEQAAGLAKLIEADPSVVNDLDAIANHPGAADGISSSSSVAGIQVRQALANGSVTPAELRKYLDAGGDFNSLGQQTPEGLRRTVKLRGRAPVSTNPRDNVLHTPSGNVHAIHPQTGEVVPIRFEDGRNKHTLAGDLSMARMQKIVGQTDDRTSRENRLLQEMAGPRAASTGGQLSKEATENYGALVQEAAENGLWVKDDKGVTKLYYRFDSPIGIEIGNPPKVTNWVRIDTAPGAGNSLQGAHVIPVTPPPHIQRQL
ncbi:MAG: hypothetical protein AAFV29_18970, partial [Myxococcota bacterium]